MHDPQDERTTGGLPKGAAWRSQAVRRPSKGQTRATPVRIHVAMVLHAASMHALSRPWCSTLLQPTVGFASIHRHRRTHTTQAPVLAHTHVHAHAHVHAHVHAHAHVLRTRTRACITHTHTRMYHTNSAMRTRHTIANGTAPSTTMADYTSQLPILPYRWPGIPVFRAVSTMQYSMYGEGWTCSDKAYYIGQRLHHSRRRSIRSIRSFECGACRVVPRRCQLPAL